MLLEMLVSSIWEHYPQLLAPFIRAINEILLSDLRNEDGLVEMVRLIVWYLFMAIDTEIDITVGPCHLKNDSFLIFRVHFLA